MANTYSRLVAHTVFSTRNRIPMIREAIEEEVFHYLGGAINGQGGQAITCGGYLDHVHLLYFYRPTMALSKLLQEIKKTSSGWMKDRFEFREFHWQEGGGYFSVDHRNIDSVVQYIRNQKAHHKKESFAEEYRRIVEENGIEFDARYLLDPQKG